MGFPEGVAKAVAAKFDEGLDFQKVWTDKKFPTCGNHDLPNPL